MQWQRTMLAIAAVACVLSGVYLATVAVNPHNVSGILVRVGLMLGVTSFALPQIFRLGRTFPVWLLAAIFVMLALAAARPRMLIPLVLLFAIGLALHWFRKTKEDGAKKRGGG